MRLIISILITLSAFLLFACSVIGAGHGAIPVGLFLLLALPRFFEFPFTLAWFATLAGWGAAVFLFVLPWFIGRHRYPATTGMGLALLAVSWFCFLGLSEPPFRSLSPSIPFSLLLVIWFVFYGRSLFQSNVA
jgi:hypothetical protein